MNNPTLNLRQYMQEQTPLQTRSGDKAFVFILNKWHPYPFTGAVITENNVFVYSWTLEGRVYAEKPHDHDIVGLWQEPAQLNIDLDKCIKDHTPLRTRDGRKALVLGVGPNDVYKYKGVLIGQGGRVDTTSWAKDGVYYEGEVCGADIVGLWKEGEN